MSEQSQCGEYPMANVADAWARMAGSMVKSAAAANRATAAALGATDSSEGTNGTSPDGDEASEERRPGVPSVDYEEGDWTFERTVDRPEDIGVGDTVSFSKLVDDDDVRGFAAASGDTNRLHLDEEFAEETRFQGRIVHGTLASGLISAALARLPGLTIYLSQDLEFRNPVRIGTRIRATAEVVEDLGERQFRLRTRVEEADGEEVIIDGEATVLIDDPPEE